jgi:chromosome segregation ATPase
MLGILSLPSPAAGQSIGRRKVANPQGGYEGVARQEEQNLNFKLTALDGMVRRGEVCDRLTDYQLRIEDAKTQVEAVRRAWDVYFTEVEKKQEILIATAKRTIQDYESDRHKIEADRRKLNDDLADLQRRMSELPPGTPADRKISLTALVDGTKLQMGACDKLLEALAKEFEGVGTLASMDELIKSAYQLQSTATDLYHRANRLLVEIRYQGPISRCLGLPQAPRN